MQRKLWPHEKTAVDEMQECVQLLMESTTEIGEHAYWLKIKNRLERMAEHGTSDGHPIQVSETPKIPEGYRKAETGDSGRPDAKFLCPFSDEWVDANGRTSPIIQWPFIVPDDVVPSEEEAELGTWVMVRDSSIDPWRKRQLIRIGSIGRYQFRVLSTDRISILGYRYARHLRSYEK